MSILDPVTPGGIVRGDAWAGAEFSPCGRYRFRLWRTGLALLTTPRTPGRQSLVAFVMLNPSTADENTPDPTIRRCTGFARAWGYDGIVVANLFALISTDPDGLDVDDDDGATTGRGNDHAIVMVCESAALVVCAWGAHETGGRGDVVREYMRRAHHAPHHLGLTYGGHPKHPVRLRADTKPVWWT